MTTKSNAGKKAGGAESVKAKASADSIKKMRPSDVAGSGKPKAPSDRSANLKPASPSASVVPADGAAVSGKMGRASRRGSKRSEEMGLRTNLSADIAGLDKVVEREKQREKLIAAQASGQSIKTTDRAARETRKVYAMVGVVLLGLVAIFAFIIYKGYYAPPSAGELADLNKIAAAKMGVALHKIDSSKIRDELKGKVPSDAEKQTLLRKYILQQVALLEAKAQKERDDVTNSRTARSLDDIQSDLRGLAVCQTFKDAYGDPWMVEFDKDDFVSVKTLGANKHDDSGEGAREGKADDLVVSAYMPLHVPALMETAAIGPVAEAPAPHDPTHDGGTRPAPSPETIGRGPQQDNSSYLKLQQAHLNQAHDADQDPSLRGMGGDLPPPPGERGRRPGQPQLRPNIPSGPGGPGDNRPSMDGPPPVAGSAPGTMTEHHDPVAPPNQKELPPTEGPINSNNN